MKLIFPNGEHSQALLSDGVNRVGSASDAQISLHQPGILSLQCEIQLSGENVTLSIPEGVDNVSVNGRAVSGVLSLRAGDLLGLAGVQARLSAVEKVAATVHRPVAVDDSGATRVRQAVPRFVLRGVSGSTFGKTYPIPGPVVIGRQADCDIAVPTEEISRRHAMIKPTADGLMVEDLGSANGTYINGKRVQNGLMRPGEELRLDTIRFLLVAPGMEMPSTQRVVAPAGKSGGKGALFAVLGAILVAAAVAAAIWYLRP